MAYSIALALLGLSAAFCGKWVERNGPRKTMLASMLCFCSGLFLSAIAVRLAQPVAPLRRIWPDGGVGLGLGYISPVSTLMKWFLDRPGMATGMAIMGFGGGALIGGPLAEDLMKRFASTSSVGASEAMLVMAGMYADLDDFRGVDCSCAARGMVPPGMVGSARGGAARHPFQRGRRPRVEDAAILDVVGGAVHERERRYRHLGQASPMIQDMFRVTPAAAAGYVVVLRCATWAAGSSGRRFPMSSGAR